MTHTTTIPNFWVTPVADREDLAAADCLRLWLDRGFWGFFGRNQARMKVRASDWVAFYPAKQGVIAYARVTGAALTILHEDSWPEPTPPRGDVYQLPLEAVTWLQTPVTVPSVIPRLKVFQGKRPRAVQMWAWLVNSTRQIPEADFLVLTGR